MICLIVYGWIISQNPAAKKIYDLFIEHGETVVNDHIAFKTLNDPRVNIDVLARIFIKHGYEPNETYHFAEKHLHANHFTVSVNHLKKLDTLEKVNEFLKDNGFSLTSSGAEIKDSYDELLLQSSTLAELISVSFRDGVMQIPACYYEFAKRFKDKNGRLYNGFIAKSVDKTFESTDSLTYTS